MKNNNIMSTLTKLSAIQILDSRGNPTLAVTAYSKNHSATAMVPSGASTGSHEALELRDNDSSYYKGKGVRTAILHIRETIGPKLIGMPLYEQSKIDQTMIELDGTSNKSSLGANAILGVSMAYCKLSALEKGIPLYQYIFELATSEGLNITAPALPQPYFNIINGGEHADSGLSIQEFMIVPQQATFHEMLRTGSEVFHELQTLLKKQHFSTAVGDEGGFAPKLKGTEQAINSILEAAKRSGHDVMLACDIAANSFYDNGTYTIDNKQLSTKSYAAYLTQLAQVYPIVSLEDPFFEEDFDSFAQIKKALPKVNIIGDDLYVTNRTRLKAGIDHQSTTGILIKLNQIGSLTETLQTIALAQQHGQSYMISHRSGETEDTFIADLAVGTAAPTCKFGSLSRSERIAKYNRLLQIEYELTGEN